MKFKNILNLYEVEMQSKNKRISHYNISSSIINSNDLGSKKLFFDVKELKPGQLSYPYHIHIITIQIMKNYSLLLMVKLHSGKMTINKF